MSAREGQQRDRERTDEAERGRAAPAWWRVTASDWFEVGRLHLGSGDFVRIEVTEQHVRLVRAGRWSLMLDRPQALRLSEILDSAVAWWPPQRDDHVDSY